MAMLEISRILNSTLELSPLLRMIVHAAVKLTDCEDSSILLIDPRSGELRFETSAKQRAQDIVSLIVPMDSSVAGWIVRHNKPAIIHDAKNDPRFLSKVDLSIGFSTSSILGVPMRFRERVIGVVEAVNKREGRFTDVDIERLAILAADAAVAVENTRMLSELQRAYEDLNELDHLKSEFISTTSHELRTPLTAIKGYLQLVTSGMVPPEQQQTVLQTMSRHVDTIVHLVNDLLLIQEMHAIDLHFAEVDMGALVRGEIEMSRERAESSGIRWILDVAPDLPAVWGDAGHLRKLLHNLLDNAIKFSPDGGDVTVSLCSEKERCYLTVSDPGIGIPFDEQQKIFERFYRVERSGDRRLFGGIGIGLSIAKRITEGHGGTISVFSEPGQGSTFTVTLPLKKQGE